jgi:hypothetical protein
VYESYTKLLAMTNVLIFFAAIISLGIILILLASLYGGFYEFFGKKYNNKIFFGMLIIVSLYFFERLREYLFISLYFLGVALLIYPVIFFEKSNFKYSNICINIYKVLWLIPSYFLLLYFTFEIGEDSFNYFMKEASSHIGEDLTLSIVIAFSVPMIFFAGGHFLYFICKIFIGK